VAAPQPHTALLLDMMLVENYSPSPDEHADHDAKALRDGVPWEVVVNCDGSYTMEEHIARHKPPSVLLTSMWISTIVANTVSQLVFANSQPTPMQGLPLAIGAKASQWGGKESWMLFDQVETYSAEARVVLPSLLAPFGLPQPSVAVTNVTVLLPEQRDMPSGHHVVAKAWRQPDVTERNATSYCGHLVIASGVEQSAVRFTVQLSGSFPSGNEGLWALRLFAADYEVAIVGGVFSDWLAPAGHNVYQLGCGSGAATRAKSDDAAGSWNVEGALSELPENSLNFKSDDEPPAPPSCCGDISEWTSGWAPDYAGAPAPASQKSMTVRHAVTPFGPPHAQYFVHHVAALALHPESLQTCLGNWTCSVPQFGRARELNSSSPGCTFIQWPAINHSTQVHMVVESLSHGNSSRCDDMASLMDANEAPPSVVRLMTDDTLTVKSLDGSISVAIDGSSGDIKAITTRGVRHAVTGGATLEGTIKLQVSARAVDGGGALISKLVCIPVQSRGGDVLPCSNQKARVETLLSPRATSVGWTLNASSPTDTTTPTPLWSMPVVTNVTFAESGDKQFWAPWERMPNSQAPPDMPLDLTDALVPSDGEFSWWNARYLLGGLVVPNADGWVIAEMATILHPARDIGVSFIPSPKNPPAHPTFLDISGPATRASAGCRAAGDCHGPASFSVSRHHLRFGDGAAPHVFHTDIVAHEACWRAALGWSAREHATFWEPVSPRIKLIEGLGSYGSYLGNVTDSKFREMGYALNWDLSGRFFPYAGQFLPPVGPGEIWLNDGQGSQPRQNISFGVIDDYYGRTQAEGFSTLSYFNVFEWGINVCSNSTPGLSSNCPWCHISAPCAGVPGGGVVPSSTDAWANSTAYLLEHFPQSVITDFGCGGNQWCLRTAGSRAPEGTPAAIGTWQGGIVLDPACPELKAHFVAQLKRKYNHISNFEGLVVDRADWNALYNHAFDDGSSFIANRTAQLAQYSYLDTLASLRDLMAARAPTMRINETVMLSNNQGFAQLSLFEHMDGSFSEGGAINAQGILAARSTAILWVYGKTECCSSQTGADRYFQRHLYMKVFPMAPFPQADHAIPEDPAAEVFFLQYGALFSSLRGAKWLLKAHAVNVTGGPAVANVFELPHSPGQAGLWALMLGGNQTGASLSVAYLHADIGPGSFEVLHPRDIVPPPPPPPVAAHSCADEAPLTFALAGPDPTTIKLGDKCLAANAAYAGASLAFGDCSNPPTSTQLFTFAAWNASSGGGVPTDCPTHQPGACRNIQLLARTSSSKPLCLEFKGCSHTGCDSGSQVWLWLCNGGFLQNVTWTAPRGGRIEYGPAGGASCLGIPAETAAESRGHPVREPAGWVPLPSSQVELAPGGAGRAVLKVPLVRGCAMVRVKTDAGAAAGRGAVAGAAGAVPPGPALRSGMVRTGDHRMSDSLA
jgi:hypothetical protein